MVFQVAAAAVAMMRCAGCSEIMGQGERSRNPSTATGQPVHAGCMEAMSAPTKEISQEQLAEALALAREP